MDDMTLIEVGMGGLSLAASWLSVNAHWRYWDFDGAWSQFNPGLYGGGCYRVRVGTTFGLRSCSRWSREKRAVDEKSWGVYSSSIQMMGVA